MINRPKIDKIYLVSIKYVCLQSCRFLISLSLSLVFDLEVRLQLLNAVVSLVKGTLLRGNNLLTESIYFLS